MMLSNPPVERSNASSDLFDLHILETVYFFYFDREFFVELFSELFSFFGLVKSKNSLASNNN